MKTGLVLEGGAIRTIFSCGATDALLDNGIMTDYVIGVSAGIAYGVSYASKQSGRNLEILRRFVRDKRYMGINNLVNPKNRSYYNLKFSFEDIPETHVPFDFEAFYAFPGQVVAVVSNLETGQAEYIEVPRDDHAFKLLKATCAMPLLFPVIKIGGKPYLDGGVTDPIPFRQALKQGCEKTIVILTREYGYRKESEKALALAARRYWRYPQFCRALLERATRYNENLTLLNNLEAEGKMLTVRPRDTTGFSRLEKDVDKINCLYQEGYRQVTERLDEIRNYLAK